MPNAVADPTEAFAPIEAAARTLRWADERPWTVRTHLRVEDGVVVIDLHDLNARLAKQALDVLIPLASSADAGAVVVVTGRGLHSRGGSVLPQLAHKRMLAAARDRGWRVTVPRAGRIALIADESRIPNWLQTGTSPWTWALLALIAAGVLATVWRMVGA